VAVSIAETVPFPFATSTLVPSGLIATPTGFFPTSTVDVTVFFVAMLITETVLIPAFETYTFFPSGVTVSPCGETPTLTVATNAIG